MTSFHCESLEAVIVHQGSIFVGWSSAKGRRRRHRRRRRRRNRQPRYRCKLFLHPRPNRRRRRRRRRKRIREEDRIKREKEREDEISAYTRRRYLHLVIIQRGPRTREPRHVRGKICSWRKRKKKRRNNAAGLRRRERKHGTRAPGNLFLVERWWASRPNASPLFSAQYRVVFSLQ